VVILLIYLIVLKSIVYFEHSVDWSGRRRRLLREKGPGETPQALAPRRLPGSPAESEAAWSGNQQTSLTQPFTKNGMSKIPE
jgi:hypothetical protein